MENKDLDIFISFIEIGATLLSVLSAILFVRISDHLNMMFKKREDLLINLNSFAMHYSNFIENIKYVSDNAEKAIIDAQNSIAEGQKERSIYRRFHFGGGGSNKEVKVDNLIDIKECRILVGEAHLLKFAHKRLCGIYYKKDMLEYIKRLNSILKKIDPSHMPDNRSSVAACPSFDMVMNHIVSFEGIYKSVEEYKTQLFSKPLILLDIFVVIFLIAGVVFPVGYSITHLFLSVPVKYAGMVLILGSIIFCAYLLYLLYEIYLMSILKWDK